MHFWKKTVQILVFDNFSTHNVSKILAHAFFIVFWDTGFPNFHFWRFLNMYCSELFFQHKHFQFQMQTSHERSVYAPSSRCFGATSLHFVFKIFFVFLHFFFFFFLLQNLITFRSQIFGKMFFYKYLWSKSD